MGHVRSLGLVLVLASSAAFLALPTVPVRAGTAAALGEAGSGPAMLAAPVPAATNGIAWSDVPKNYWDRSAIDYVGATNDWMRDYHALDDGTYPFKPDKLESRERFARAAVRAFAADRQPDPSLHFPDLPDDDRFYRFANVAVSLGWMEVDDHGNFRPGSPVTTRVVHRAMAYALGMRSIAHHLQHLEMADGTPLDVPSGFGTLLLGMRLGLRYNHSDESMDVGPDARLPRSEVAWSLYRAATEPSWEASSLAPYGTMVLPNLSAEAREVVEFGFRYVGYPYVWGGEWYRPTPAGYCCGAQPVGGFDCSGFSWWVLRQASSAWDPVPPRRYQGWSLPQRTSADMASAGTHIGFQKLRPGDLMFYDGDSDGTVDHVDVYIGNGWSMDSGGSVGGVSIVQVDDGWYRDHFVHGRRVIR